MTAVTADAYADGDKHSLTDLYSDWQEKFKQIIIVIELCENMGQKWVKFYDTLTKSKKMTSKMLVQEQDEFKKMNG